jgi:hypothetical protein
MKGDGLALPNGRAQQVPDWPDLATPTPLWNPERVEGKGLVLRGASKRGDLTNGGMQSNICRMFRGGSPVRHEKNASGSPGVESALAVAGCRAGIDLSFMVIAPFYAPRGMAGSSGISGGVAFAR